MCVFCSCECAVQFHWFSAYILLHIRAGTYERGKLMSLTKVALVTGIATKTTFFFSSACIGDLSLQTGFQMVVIFGKSCQHLHALRLLLTFLKNLLHMEHGGHHNNYSNHFLAFHFPSLNFACEVRLSIASLAQPSKSS